MKKNRKSKFVFGFLVGGIVGAGLYFAATKKKGLKIPKSVIESGDGILEQGEEIVDGIRQYLYPTVESAKYNAIPLYDRVADSVVPVIEDVLDRSVSLIEEIRSRVSPTSEEIRSKVDSFSSNEALGDSSKETDLGNNINSPLDDLDIAPKKSDSHSIN